MQNSEKRYEKKRNITEIKTKAEEYRGEGTNTVENTVKSFEDRKESIFNSTWGLEDSGGIRPESYPQGIHGERAKATFGGAKREAAPLKDAAWTTSHPVREGATAQAGPRPESPGRSLQP